MTSAADFRLFQSDDHSHWSLGWSLHACYLSDYCCVVHLSWGHARQEEDEARLTLGVQLDRVLEALHGAEIYRPLVGLIDRSRCARPEESVPIAWRLNISRWPGDQSWHRGRFVVEVLEDSAAIERRALELLTAWRRDEPPLQIEPRDEPSLIPSLQGSIAPRLFDVLSTAPRPERAAADSGGGRSAADLRADRWQELLQDEVRADLRAADQAIAPAEDES